MPQLTKEVFNPSNDREQAEFEAMQYAYGANWYDSTAFDR